MDSPAELDLATYVGMTLIWRYLIADVIIGIYKQKNNAINQFLFIPLFIINGLNVLRYYSAIYGISASTKGIIRNGSKTSYCSFI